MNTITHLTRHGLALGLAVVLGAAVHPPLCEAQNDAAGAPGDWLSSFKGARYQGLGGARLTSTGDPLAVVWNPAGAAQLDRNEVHVETARLFEGTSINSFSMAVPGRRLPTIGLSILSLKSADFERTNELDESLGSFSESDLAVILSGSREINRRLAVGGSAKVIRHSVESFGATGFGGDVGAIYALTRDLSVGLSALNLLAPKLTFRDSPESYPREIRLGVSLRMLSGRGMVSTGIDQRSGIGERFHGGGEYRIVPRLAVRVGYDENKPAGGFSYDLGSTMRLDYGLMDHDLGLTHRLGFSYRFGGFAAQSDAVPPVFSPLAQPSVTQVELVAKTKADPKSWTLTITDKSNQVVRRFGGEGQPPAHVMWDGKDESGLTVPDGIYQHELVVVDLEGREISGAPRTVEITTMGPQGTVPVNVQ